MSQGLRISTPVILASASPRRKELIQRVFETVTVCPSRAPEILPDGIGSLDCAAYLARRKAVDVAKYSPNIPVIGCDTVVILGEKILTKPKDVTDAFSILKSLSGTEHLVTTGCAVAYNGCVHSFSEATRVSFWDLEDEQIESYISTGEPMDKAGAYGIQGLGALLVRQVIGDYFNVVGLPISLLYREFRALEKKGFFR